ncbi:MAG TPA: chemotaxis response regulator protein-glutamate methylesterase [Candidatus Sulfotelmatobacter sp.]|nr:chemotaxis response regulator protein-glutamate methylesterase [Candidatus Sulfotelmatobacter sp.]
MNDSTLGHSVRVLVVDGSAFMRAELARMIASEPEFEVVATASSGTEALEKVASLDPDVVTLEVQMPGLDGLGTLRCIMQQFPRPVIMVSAVTEKDAEITFNALSAGAFDYIPKQLSNLSLDIAHIRPDLIAKIRTAAMTRRLRSVSHCFRKPAQSVGRKTAEAPFPITPAVIAIGVSTGGPKALQEILPRFPRDFPVPLLIVQHMPAGFTAPFAQRLDTLCAIKVCEASAHELIRPATAYIAPAGVHMRVERRLGNGRAMISLDPEPQNALHVPSVDTLMNSVAAFYGTRALGVIMTGMGSDGAEGIKAIHRAGGVTIGQDETTCTVYGMPRVCAELGILNRVVPLNDIPTQILQAIRWRQPA